jgi:CheY-like chemotaxis protein
MAKNGLRFSIIMAEDDEDDRIFIDEAFNEIGYGAEIKKFLNGQALLKYLQQIEPSLYPSLIILDNTLPMMSAMDMIAILKQKKETKDIPVVIYSSSISPHKKEQLLQMGVHSCVEKKFTMKELVALVKEFREIAENTDVKRES